MNTSEIKESIIEAIRDHTTWFRPVSDTEYRTRCPFCGDSTTNPNIGKFYFHVELDSNKPILYNCFRCNEHGILNEEVLSAFGIDDTELKSNLNSLNKVSDKIKSTFYNNTKMQFFDYHLPEKYDQRKIWYLEKRLGISFHKEDLKKIKVITSLQDFLSYNHISEITCSYDIAKRIEDHFIGFLSYGNSHILFRDISEKDYFRWIKYPITKESVENRIFYSIESELDIFTENTININLSEGVFDILSASYNLGFDSPNTLNIAVAGKRYDGVLRYLTSIGLVGENIHLNIFADNDMQYNNKNNQPTTVDYFKQVLRKFKYLYGKVSIYYNILSKDIGVKKEEISLQKIKL